VRRTHSFRHQQPHELLHFRQTVGDLGRTVGAVVSGAQQMGGDLPEEDIEGVVLRQESAVGPSRRSLERLFQQLVVGFGRIWSDHLRLLPRVPHHLQQPPLQLVDTLGRTYQKNVPIWVEIGHHELEHLVDAEAPRQLPDLRPGELLLSGVVDQGQTAELLQNLPLRGVVVGVVGVVVDAGGVRRLRLLQSDRIVSPLGS
jgi:hypothetical protein